MRRHWGYLKYVARHKWFVFLAACRLGIPWLGIIHDWSKFLPREWFPYADYFYNPDGSPKTRRSKTGYYRPDETGHSAFDFAIMQHVTRNKHHWQAWILPADNGELTEKVFPIPDRYRREMLADWIGAGRAQGAAHVSIWWKANGHKLKLHPETRAWLDKEINKG
jgi:hypothetical protein